MSRLIDADILENRMYHEAFEKDSDMQKWDSGCWIRYKLFEKVLREQPTVTPEPHWIPVTERLPKLRHDVLLTVFFHERWNVAEGYRQEGEFMFWNNGILDSVLDEENRVRAWMPKPEPYKGVTE